MELFNLRQLESLDLSGSAQEIWTVGPLEIFGLKHVETHFERSSFATFFSLCIFTVAIFKCYVRFENVSYRKNICSRAAGVLVTLKRLLELFFQGYYRHFWLSRMATARSTSTEVEMN